MRGASRGKPSKVGNSRRGQQRLHRAVQKEQKCTEANKVGINSQGKKKTSKAEKNEVDSHWPVHRGRIKNSKRKNTKHKKRQAKTPPAITKGYPHQKYPKPVTKCPSLGKLIHKVRANKAPL